VHEYFGMDWALIWKTASEDLPVLRERLTEVHRGRDGEVRRTLAPRNFWRKILNSSGPVTSKKTSFDCLNGRR
jgi:hypothetical protein